MRYARGSKLVPETGYWTSQKIVVGVNLVALQRDVLKERRERIKANPTLVNERSEELSEIRAQIQILDSKWSRCRQREDIDARQRPLISSDEWRKLIVTKTIGDDWDLWNEKGSNEQWHALARIGYLREPGTLRPAPGVAEEGSDEDAFKIDDFLGGIDMGIPIPVLPPKTKSAAPYDVTPQENDPTSGGMINSEEKKKKGQIPERPVEPKPGPPQAPWISNASSQESESVKTAAKDTSQWCMQTMPAMNEAPANVSSPETVVPTQQDVLWRQEGSRVLGFGSLKVYTYREV